jgi:hypothetical protein
MPEAYVRRGATLAPNQSSKPNANPVYVDSDTDEFKFGTGASGTTLRIVPRYIPVTYSVDANGSLIDQAFFIADRAYNVVAVYEVHKTAGNDAGAVNVQVVKDTGTNAPGAGTDLLTNNTNAGFDLKGTASTVQTGTLVATAASLKLAAGDRLSVDFAGTLTTLAGVVVTVYLEPTE